MMNVKKNTTMDVNGVKKHSLNKNLLEIEDEDIETEIQRRRVEAINKSSEVRRRSVAVPLIAGLSGTELIQHCKDCIKLSTENKINSKNAFSFLLIDAMAAMTKKADSEINKNFQVASCTLDASVKIYGYRVDAVHTEAIKMAGGVLSKEVKNDEGNDEDLENGEDENEWKTKIKKKRKKKLTIALPETLNAKSESDLLMDFTPHQNLLMHKTDGNELLTKIPRFNDNGVLYINSGYTCWPYDDESSVPPFKRSEIFDPAALKSMLKEIYISPDEHLCPLYHNFEFGKGRDDLSDDNSSDGEIPSPDKGNGFEFDLNASVENTSMGDEFEVEEVNAQRNRLTVPQGGFESDEEIQLPPVAEKRCTKRLAIADLKNRITLDASEYSLFDEQFLKAWAGPSYWKVHTKNRRTADDDKENEGESKSVPAKRTRKGKIIRQTCLRDITDSELAKGFASGEKTTLNKATMLNWSPQNVTVPKDCMYKSKNLFSLFHLPDFGIELKREEEEEAVTVDSGEMSDSRSDQGEELEYCSNLSVQEDNVDRVSFGDGDGKADADLLTDRDEIWDEKNMVALPNRVGKIPVSTFRRKKNVDIKHLKKCLWNMIAEPSGSAVSSGVSKPISFSEIMSGYAANFPSGLASSLSAPLIFNALLHLTNEKGLTLKQESDKTDFVVTQ